MKTSSIVVTLIFLFIKGFVTAQTDALTILPNGNVGVGTTTPTQKLDVRGNGIINSVFLGDVGHGENWAGFSHRNALGTNSYGFRHHVYGIISLTNIKSDPNGFIGFRVDDQDKMVIKSNGNVGIGTPAPFEKLHIQNGNMSMRSDNNLYGSFRFGTSNSTYKEYWAGIESYNTGGLNQADLRFYTAYGNQKGERMRINQHGNVGIGTANPTQAKLVVSGNAKHNLGKFQWFAYYSSGTGIASGSNTIPYSIYATDRVAAQEFNAFSDARIKHIVGVSNTEKDLETLSKIEITDYTMIDTIAKGNQSYKKVIAQQVNEVYPKAVTTDVTEVIPNIYALSVIKDGWIQIDAKELVVGDKVKLIFSEEEALVDVLEVQGDTIKVDSNQEGSVFVYGKQVSDFHTVDYEAISMLNVSATQALLKRIEVLETDKKKLTGDFEKYKTSVNDRLSKIEQALQTETVMN